MKLEVFHITTLQRICKDLDLLQTGDKDDLIARLRQHGRYLSWIRTEPADDETVDEALLIDLVFTSWNKNKLIFSQNQDEADQVSHDALPSTTEDIDLSQATEEEPIALLRANYVSSEEASALAADGIQIIGNLLAEIDDIYVREEKELKELLERYAKIYAEIDCKDKEEVEALMKQFRLG
ncbi:hypothetical protein BDZ45DRAFT_672837 [Acephala macrosclerotiorum]|nr:hypothetical protein BDZ45DRAFT_672837 [Acephala macrosclerotiorum]